MERRRKYYITKERRVLNVVQFITLYSTVVLLIAVGLIVACAMTSCSLIDEDTAGCPATETAGTPGSAIAFDTEGISVSDGDSTARTRTAPGTMTLDGTAGTESLKAKGFGVFACHTGVHPYVSISTTSNLMWNQLVTYDNTTATWTYSPLVYWPNSDEDVPEYVTFFAYAPHSDNANGCIADMSNADDVGDPWIVYQLGGSEEADGANGWKAQQVDLLYDFRKDQKREVPPASSGRVSFSFRHALASIGDRITVSCGQSIANKMVQHYSDTTLRFVLDSLTLDYVLTRKGRLTLNASSEPNWEAVESGDPTVTRRLVLTPNQVMASAASASYCNTYEYQTEAGQGVFYIPIESVRDKQRVGLRAKCRVLDAEDSEVWTGTITASTDITTGADASRTRNLHVELRLSDSVWPVP